MCKKKWVVFVFHAHAFFHDNIFSNLNKILKYNQAEILKCASISSFVFLELEKNINLWVEDSFFSFFLSSSSFC